MHEQVEPAMTELVDGDTEQRPRYRTAAASRNQICQPAGNWRGLPRRAPPYIDGSCFGNVADCDRGPHRYPPIWTAIKACRHHTGSVHIWRFCIAREPLAVHFAAGFSPHSLGHMRRWQYRGM